MAHSSWKRQLFKTELGSEHRYFICLWLQTSSSLKFADTQKCSKVKYNRKTPTKIFKSFLYDEIIPLQQTVANNSVHCLICFNLIQMEQRTLLSLHFKNSSLIDAHTNFYTRSMNVFESKNLWAKTLGGSLLKLLHLFKKNIISTLLTAPIMTYDECHLIHLHVVQRKPCICTLTLQMLKTHYSSNESHMNGVVVQMAKVPTCPVLKYS